MRSVGLSRIFATLGLVALSGCHFFHRHGNYNTCNDPQHYANSRSIAPLKTPVGLTAPDTRSALRIPDLNEPTRRRAPERIPASIRRPRSWCRRS